MWQCSVTLFGDATTVTAGCSRHGGTSGDQPSRGEGRRSDWRWPRHRTCYRPGVSGSRRRVVVADYGGRVDRNEAGSSEAADAVVAEISAAGGTAVAAAVDISTMRGAGRCRRRTRFLRAARWHRLQRGITALKYLWDLEEQEWDDVINVHLKGHFSCAKAARPLWSRSAPAA